MVHGGKVGCETNYLDYEVNEELVPRSWPRWNDITKKKSIFKVSFNLQRDLSFLPSDAELEMRLAGVDEDSLMWMYKYPKDSFSVVSAVTIFS